MTWLKSWNAPLSGSPPIHGRSFRIASYQRGGIRGGGRGLAIHIKIFRIRAAFIDAGRCLVQQAPSSTRFVPVTSPPRLRTVGEARMARGVHESTGYDAAAVADDAFRASQLAGAELRPYARSVTGPKRSRNVLRDDLMDLYAVEETGRYCPRRIRHWARQPRQATALRAS